MLVLAVGSLNPQLLGGTSRTKKYKPSDYSTLLTFLSEFHERPLTTQSVLTETSNFLRQIDRRRDFYAPTFMAARGATDERRVRTSEALADRLFPDFGLTDCTLRWLASDEQILLTDDASLAAATPGAVNLTYLLFPT